MKHIHHSIYIILCALEDIYGTPWQQITRPSKRSSEARTAYVHLINDTIPGSHPEQYIGMVRTTYKKILKRPRPLGYYAALGKNNHLYQLVKQQTHES